MIQICLTCHGMLLPKLLLGCFIHFHGSTWLRSRNLFHSKWHTLTGLCTWISLVLPWSSHSEAPSQIEWWESLLKIQFQCQLGGSTSQGCGKFFRNLYILWLVFYLWCGFSHSRNLWVQELRARNGSGTTHYYCYDMLVKFLFPNQMILCFDGWEVLFPKGECSHWEMETFFPLNWTWKRSPGHFGLLRPLNQQAKEVFTVVAAWLILITKEEIGLLLHNGGKEEYISGIQEIP